MTREVDNGMLQSHKHTKHNCFHTINHCNMNTTIVGSAINSLIAMIAPLDTGTSFSSAVTNGEPLDNVSTVKHPNANGNKYRFKGLG